MDTPSSPKASSEGVKNLNRREGDNNWAKKRALPETERECRERKTEKRVNMREEREREREGGREREEER